MLRNRLMLRLALPGLVAVSTLAASTPAYAGYPYDDDDDDMVVEQNQPQYQQPQYQQPQDQAQYQQPATGQPQYQQPQYQDSQAQGYQQPQYQDQSGQYQQEQPQVDVAQYQQYGVGFSGPHPIPYQNGGGYCYIEGPHTHEYAPFDAHLFREYNGYYYFIGDPVDFGYDRTYYWYNGNHPIPWDYGGGYCYISWPHRHHYAPTGITGFRMVGNYWVYGGVFPSDYWLYRNYYWGYYTGYYRTSYYGGAYWRVRPSPAYWVHAPIRVGAPPGRSFGVGSAPRVIAPPPAYGYRGGASYSAPHAVGAPPAAGYHAVGAPSTTGGYHAVGAPPAAAYRSAPAATYHPAPQAYRPSPVFSSPHYTSPSSSGFRPSGAAPSYSYHPAPAYHPSAPSYHPAPSRGFGGGGFRHR